MEYYTLLNKINSPEDLKKIEKENISDLCAEIRDFLISTISVTGGHLASNLGAVELTVALHRVFNSPSDSIMFDVGHQCYTHKIITGRKDRFDSLRSFHGLSGFLRPDESPHDCFVSGHASNSISAALGLARGKMHKGDTSRTICVVGDGALTGGMIYEAMNDVGQSNIPLIVVFNDNEMSISRNVGAVAQRLSTIRLKPRYFKAKRRVKGFFSRFKWGEGVIKGISNIKRRLKHTLLKESLFEIMGFSYLGPADGHDEALVENLLEEAAHLNRPVVVHLKTVKGKGYYPSEQSPGQYHGVSSFDIISGPNALLGETFSTTFGRHMCTLAKANPNICAITAAMTDNTGLSDFANTYPNRFYDVGIAEEHGVTMSAGLAKSGMIPVFAVYSTFLQRGYDQLLHDVAIDRLHVVFAVDRAGIVGADGQTHQGAFDVPYLLTVPNMALLAPGSHAELETALDMAVAMNQPVAVRYPRGGEGKYRENQFSKPIVNIKKGGDITIISYGIMINEAVLAAEMLAQRNIFVDLLKINRLDSLDNNAIFASVSKTKRVIILEDCNHHGSLGMKVSAMLAQNNIEASIKLLNLGDSFIKEGKVNELYSEIGIDAGAIVTTAEEMVAIHD